MTESYWTRVRDKAAQLGSDGCSNATGAFADCCLEHDILYRTGMTLDGDPISRRDADARFKACMRRHSRLGWFSPMALIRWSAVRMFGGNAYLKGVRDEDAR